MTDLSEFYAENTASSVACAVATVLRNLPPDKAEALRKALASPWKRTVPGEKFIQHMAISRVAKKWDIALSPDSIGRHRGKVCSCAH